MGIVSKAVKFLISPIGTIIGGKVGKLITAATLIGAGIISGNPSLIMAGLAYGASALQKKPKVSQSALDRLTANINPAAPRTIVLGRTAMATDVRYQAYTGTGQEYAEQIMCIASHKVEAVEEIWFDTELAWTVAGGAQGRFAGYLTVAVKLEGTSGNTVTIDANWGSAQRLTGCAYLHLKYKLTGATAKATSPFSSAVPTRVTIRGKGGFVPDPRLSTAAGGSGSQSMSDQSTWAYTTAADSGRNLACQTLFYLLGWKIGGKLAVGLGAPSTRIDFASFITAANICDESVAKAGGGTEPRYRGDGIFSEDDDPDTVLTSLLQAMNAELTDESGKIAIRIDLDDLATPAVTLTQSDIIDGDDWKPSASTEDENVVRGKYTNPDNGSLYQLVDYPQVTLAGSDYGSPDGIQRIDTFDLPMVQSPSQAQRLAKLRLQRKQYPGVFTARFNLKGWGASYGKIVSLSHTSLSFSAKKFRVKGQTIHVDGTVTLVLREVSSSQFTWSAEEAAVVAPAVPTAYDPLNNPLVAGIGDAGVTAVWSAVTDDNGHRPDNDADVTASNTAASIFGQGGLATLNQVTLGTNVYRSGGAVLVNADVITNLGTAAAFTGQAAIATDSDAVNRILSMRGDNFARNGFFNEGPSQFGLGSDASYVTLSSANNPAPYGIRFAAAPASNANSWAYINNITGVAYSSSTIFLSVWVKTAATVGLIGVVRCYDSAANYISDAVAINTATIPSSAAWQQVTGSANLPANTAIINVYFQRQTTLTNTMDLTGFRVAPTAAGATVGSVFNSNTWRNDGVTLVTDALAVTSLGTAAAIVSQSAWATYTGTIASVTQPGKNQVFNGSVKLGVQGWNLSGWTLQNDSSGRYFLGNADNTYFYSQNFRADAGLTFAASLSYSGTASICYFYLNWFTSGGAFISSSATQAIPAGTGRISLSAVAPATTFYASVTIYRPVGAGYQTATQIKVEYAPTGVATVFSDEATSGALYQSGVTIDSLQPAESGANITSTHTAAAFTGQAAIATDSDAVPRILAMRGDNFARNGNFSEGASAYYLGPSAHYATLGAGYPASHGVYFGAGENVGNSYFWVNNTSAVPFAAQIAFVSMYIYSGLTATAITIQFYCYDGSGAQIGTPYAQFSVPALAAFAPFKAAIPMTPGTASAGFYIYRHGSNGSNCYVTSIRWSATESSADLTRVLTLAPAQAVQYDYTGTTTAQLPKILTCNFYGGGADVTPSTSFVFTASGCTIDGTGCLTGQVRLTAVTAANAAILVDATYLGVTRSGSIPLQRLLGANPGGAGGGGAGATGFSVDVSATITDTAYDGSPQPLYTTTARMRSNGSGQIRITLNAEYHADPNYTAQINAKAQKSTDASTWSDAGLSASGTSAAGSYWIDNDGNGMIDPGDTTIDEVVGTISANSLVGSFTASTDYYIRWIAYKSGTMSSVGISGTVSGAQS